MLLQDLTGVPVIVDFAAMRDAFKSLGGDPSLVNPLCPTDLVIDHSVQVDFSRAYVIVKVYYYLLFFIIYKMSLVIVRLTHVPNFPL